jgi:hypothetical protein
MKTMAAKERYGVEWTDDGTTKEVRIGLRNSEMVITKGRAVLVSVGRQKVAIRKGRSVKGVELLRSLVLNRMELLPGDVPEETVIFTHNSPPCVNIPTRNGWVRW